MQCDQTGNRGSHRLYPPFFRDDRDRPGAFLLGGFVLLFLAGMGLWLFALPRLRRTSVMLIALCGLGASIVGLTIINSLGDLSRWEACFLCGLSIRTFQKQWNLEGTERICAWLHKSLLGRTS